MPNALADRPLGPSQQKVVIETTAAIKALVFTLTHERDFPELEWSLSDYSKARSYMRAVMAKCIEMIDKAEAS